jgi:Icc-related predicted phosphoesterase
MKMQIVSDLHLEFAPIEINNAGSDILILAGDICVVEYFNASDNSPKKAYANIALAFFEATCPKFDTVIYILGNHEHYNGRFDKTMLTLKHHLGHIPNLHIMNNEVLVLEDICFFGTTLWTDFNRNDIGAKVSVQNSLNDYHVVKFDQYRKLIPNDTQAYFNKAIAHIDELTAPKIVVVGHHAPSFRSVTPAYRNDGLINFGYYSDLERFIDDRPAIKLWVHGHVHSSHDYEIGSTRIVANPRGYVKGNRPPENADFNPNKIFSI